MPEVARNMTFNLRHFHPYISVEKDRLLNNLLVCIDVREACEGLSTPSWLRDAQYAADRVRPPCTSRALEGQSRQHGRSANGPNGSRAQMGPMSPRPKWAKGSRAQMGQWAQRAC